MSLGKRLFTEGAAACLTETTDIFGDSSGKALYSMDYDASDTSGVYNGTPTNVDFGVSGQINTGARFNGSNAFIDTGGALVNSLTAITIAGWFKSQPNTNYSYGLHFGTLGSAGDAISISRWNNTPSGDFGAHTLYLNDGSNSVDGNFTLNENTLYHIAITWTGTTIKFYVNGNLETTATAAASLSIPASGNSGYIGRYISNQSFNWKGTVDQVRVFSSAITDSQVSTLYAETACVHTSTTDTVNFPSGTTNAAYFKMDNSAKDEVSGNTGSDTNVQYRFGKYNQSAFFNDTGIINTGFTRSGTSISVSLWLNLNDNGTRQIFLGDGDTNGADTSITLSAQVDDDDDVKIFVNNGQSSGNVNTVVSYAGKYNKWTHFVVTLNGTSGAVYLDNTKTTFTADRSMGTAAQAFAIGSWSVTASNGGETDGFIDQVRFYNAQLSDANVTSLYNEKPETDTSNFKTVLYDGTNATQYISNVGIDLETSGGLVWFKNRTGTNSNALVDSVRGRGEYLYSDTTTVQSGTSGATNDLISFEKNGFFVGSVSQAGSTNTSGGDIVAWVFKGGGAASANTVGDIDSQVSLNSTLGFSIVSYTGDANQSNTIGHGLKVGTTETRPDLIIVRNRTATNNPSWMVWSSVFSSASEGLLLNDNLNSTTITNRFGTISTTTFKGGTNGNNEVNGANPMIAYCFASVSGLSKIGTYTGDGTSSGTTISVGFKPSFLIVKNIDTSATNWFLFDSRRDPSNPLDSYLQPNTNAAEADFNSVNFNDTGFELLSNLAYLNQSSDKYLYIAFK